MPPKKKVIAIEKNIKLKVKWPALSKIDQWAPPPLTTLLENQIITLPLFDPPICKAYVKLCESLPMEKTPPAIKGMALRTNDRWQLTDPEFAKRLWEDTGLSDVCGHWTEKPNMKGEVRAVGLNSNIRVYRYPKGAFFQRHYDDHAVDPVTGHTTQWTLLVYLTGEEDGVRGGETIFYTSTGSGKKAKEEPLVAKLSRGTALLHRHGSNCLVHEGSEVLEGVKWVLRSDICFA
ncbi:hypothetical protein YB2330_002974 [Saitoella coloradoensis]